MSREKLYQSQWSIDDISRYVDGDMTKEEVMRFEADLASDPFFKDAVDGYAGHARIYVDHHLQRLDQKFNEKNRRSLVPMWTIGAAASLILLVAAWFVIGPRLDFRSLATADRMNTNESASKPEKIDRSAETITESNQTILFEDSVNSFDSMSMAQEEEQAAELPPASTRVGANSNNQPTRVKRRSKRAPKKNGGVVSGIVLDEGGVPLIGANVYFPNNEAGTTTDFNGKFAVELRSHDSVVIVNYTGYNSGVFALLENTNHKFRLTPDETKLADIAVDAPSEPESSDVDQFVLDAVALAEKDEKSKEMEATDNLSIESIKAQPEKGFKKYERYIRRNLKYPLAARAARIEGVVQVEFKVLRNGDLFDVRVINGLGYGCDEEAVRLIKEGPSWIDDKQTGVRQGSYSIEFKLK